MYLHIPACAPLKTSMNTYFELTTGLVVGQYTIASYIAMQISRQRTCNYTQSQYYRHVVREGTAPK